MYGSFAKKTEQCTESTNLCCPTGHGLVAAAKEDYFLVQFFDKRDWGEAQRKIQLVGVISYYV